MALADALLKAVQKPGTKCSFVELYETLTPEDAKALRAALADKRVANTAIVRALHAEGHAITKSPVERHRKLECACGTL